MVTKVPHTHTVDTNVNLNCAFELDRNLSSSLKRAQSFLWCKCNFRSSRKPGSEERRRLMLLVPNRSMPTVLSVYYEVPIQQNTWAESRNSQPANHHHQRDRANFHWLLMGLETSPLRGDSSFRGWVYNLSIRIWIWIWCELTEQANQAWLRCVALSYLAFTSFCWCKLNVLLAEAKTRCECFEVKIPSRPSYQQTNKQRRRWHKAELSVRAWGQRSM